MMKSPGWILDKVSALNRSRDLKHCQNNSIRHIYIYVFVFNVLLVLLLIFVFVVYMFSFKCPVPRGCASVIVCKQNAGLLIVNLTSRGVHAKSWHSYIFKLIWDARTCAGGKFRLYSLIPRMNSPEIAVHKIESHRCKN